MKQTTKFSQVYSNKGASVRTSYHGSLTIEAAMAVPFFFFTILCIVYLLEFMATQTVVRMGAQYACKELAKNCYVLPVAVPGEIEKDIVECIGTERLQNSLIVGKGAGLHCERSYVNPKTGEIHLHVRYRVRLPFPELFQAGLEREEEIFAKGWTGYISGSAGERREEIVYIAENGVVFHHDYSCTHLELSIRPVNRGDIEGLRNEYQGKYKPCERCNPQGNVVYITQMGDKYHGNLACSGLKRKVYSVPISEAVGMGECKRCGKSK